MGKGTEASNRVPSVHSEGLGDVLLHPFDDAARLRYADWLEIVRDLPRATFIRAQVKLAQILYDRRPPRSPGEAAKLAGLVAGLVTEHTRRAWAGSAKLGVDWAFARGFAEHVSCDARTFLEQPFDDVPLISLRLTAFRGVSEAEFFGSRKLQRLYALDLDGVNLTTPGLEALVRTRAVHNLRWLSLRSNGVDVANVSLLFRSRTLSKLRFCDFEDRVEEVLAHRSARHQAGWELPAVGLDLARRYGLKPWQLGRVRYGKRPTLYELAAKPPMREGPRV